MKNRVWAALFALVFLLCALLLRFLPRGGESVEIWQEGRRLYTLLPAAMEEARDITLRYPGGESVVRVGREGVYMLSADCPNQNCVEHGELRPNGLPIVCLPQRIVIRWSRSGELDAVVG